MDYIVDANGKQIPVSYFGNLKEKHDTCRGYVEMYNAMASDKGMPLLNLEYALAKIKKAHDKFYGYDNKYFSNGKLRE
ncbi:MAG: hypothetical protein CMF22_10155 [Idiomarinaceae bacterium]|nr:hypothetical protein [Idiomarinaceae bacterium]MBG23804.1 hypothetical protein [Idiomarinaceae bacterium]|tara:strand:+ start:41234 stop:41467 length:234 start_codon:yes stop_codon:yes gene_type:complete